MLPHCVCHLGHPGCIYEIAGRAVPMLAQKWTEIGLSNNIGRLPSTIPCLTLQGRLRAVRFVPDLRKP